MNFIGIIVGLVALAGGIWLLIWGFKKSTASV